VVRIALLVLVAAACVEEKYRCVDDLDCNLGADGVCEVDKLCTNASVTCSTGREYGPLQGPISGTCYDERRDPLNPCAEGQPPARGENACTAAVCEAMPSCCRSGWSEACVKQAQLRCTTPPHEVVCDTRIAITAVRGTGTEVWTATFTPDDGWGTPVPYAPAASLSWFAPARDTIQPRLGVFSAGSADPPVNATLTIDGTTHTLDARAYFQAQSIDFSRDAHDVLVLGSQGGGAAFYETFDLDTKIRRPFQKQFTHRTVVGEVNRDMYPDIASCNSNGSYVATLNEPPAEGTKFRQLGVSSGDTINGMETTTMPDNARSIEFADVDNNGALDLIVAGKHVRIHSPASPDEPLNASVHTLNFDCLPPMSPAGTCTGAQQAIVSWVATARPGIDRTTLIAAPWANLMNGNAERRIFEIELDRTSLVSQTFVPMGPCLTSCDKRWVAIATRDLDGDHVMDIIAIDEILNIYTTSSRNGGTLQMTMPLMQPGQLATDVRLTVTGAPYVSP
jgi:hypothetical protein